METAVQKKYSLEDYLEMEYHAETRHYFYDGKVAPMPYTSDNHGLIVTEDVYLNVKFEKPEHKADQ